MRLKREQVLLDYWQGEYLRKKAKELDRSICSLVRECLNAKIVSKKKFYDTKKEDTLAFEARKLTEGRC